MKKILLLFLSLLLTALCLWAAPLTAGADNDSDDNHPPLRPPTGVANTAAVYMSLSELEVLFLDDADNAVVEIYDENDTLVYRMNGKVVSYDTLRVDARQWQGSYTVQVTLKGRSQTFKLAL